MKKILALVLVLIMALGLAACAAPAAPAEEPTPAAEPETEKVDSQAILAELKTPAEESNWERTTSSQEVIDFLDLDIMDAGKAVPRKADLRAFVLTGEKTTVWASGLTRFSRNPDSFIVNSSQGGGFKDTWVLSR